MPRKKPGSNDGVLLKRRQVLGALGGVAGATALGCSDSGGPDGTGGATSGSTTGVGGAGGAGGSGTTSSSGGGGGADPIGSCGETTGLTPGELLAPIDTIVVLCMENRSFDHYLGSLKLKEGHASDGLSSTFSNLDANGVPIPVFHLNDLTNPDPPHDWDPVHEQWNLGANDGFVTVYTGPNQQDPMGYFVRDQLPTTYALADAFTVCDRWFCSVLGPTWPNRFYLHGATANGQKSNLPAGITSIYDVLEAKGITSRNYFHDIPWRAAAYGAVTGNSSIETFFDDAEAGTLPQFSIIDPRFFGGTANDDHPDHDVSLGQALIASVFAALAQGPQWSKCLFILTYDEHGGFFDHVPPPTTVDGDAEFTQLGFRVPTIVAGPFVRRGCVSSTVMEHVSVIKTLTLRYGLQSLNGRVDATADVSSVIDPEYLAAPQPPPVLPMVDVSMSTLERLERAPEALHHHREMREVADRGGIPKHLDRRDQGASITRTVLAHGKRLGAVRFVP